MPYPLVTLLKTHYICDSYKINKYNPDDYFVFVDADSIFLDKSNCKIKNIYDKVYQELVSNDLCFAESPWVQIYDIFCNENDMCKNSQSYITIDECINFRINDLSIKHRHCAQTSMFMGTLKELDYLDNEIMNLLAKDLNSPLIPNVRTIPYMVDQSLINKIIYTNKSKKYKINWYIHNKYMGLDNYPIDKTNYSHIMWLSEYCIVMQKINKDSKKLKRNKPTFDNAI